MAEEEKTTSQYHCGLCGGTFKTEAEIREHAETHMHEKEPHATGTESSAEASSKNA